MDGSREQLGRVLCRGLTLGRNVGHKLAAAWWSCDVRLDRRALRPDEERFVHSDFATTALYL